MISKIGEDRHHIAEDDGFRTVDRTYLSCHHETSHKNAPDTYPRRKRSQSLRFGFCQRNVTGEEGVLTFFFFIVFPFVEKRTKECVLVVDFVIKKKKEKRKKVWVVQNLDERNEMKRTLTAPSWGRSTCHPRRFPTGHVSLTSSPAADAAICPAAARAA